MKKLIVVGHPHLEESTVSRAWIEGLRSLSDPDLTIHCLAEAIREDGTFDIAVERKLLKEADRVILQFPMYWMSVPGLMKCWIDEVWTGGTAFGGEGILDDTVIDLATSAGAPSEEGFGEGGLEGIFAPLIGSVDFAGATFGRIFSFLGAGSEDAAERLRQNVEYYKHFCTD